MLNFKKLLLMALIGLGSTVDAQRWHFGTGGGMNITTGGITSLPGSPINTLEGCAEVIDQSNGQIIMYTDGKNIWNGSHTAQSTILNTGWNASQLAGLQSSTHAALIAPIPNTANTKFFVFTTTAGTATNSAGGHGPLRVSLLTLSSGTAPSAVFASTPGSLVNQVLSPSGILVGEKIAIAPDNACGYWVITDGVGTYGANSASGAPATIAPPASSPPLNTNGEGKFYAYHVTDTTLTIGGLKATQVVSTFASGAHKSWGYSHMNSEGTTINYTPNDYTVSRGQMKFNQQGNKLACALTNQQEVQIYDFDPATGLLSNQVRLYGDNAFGGYGAAGNHLCYQEGLPYGLEFSPNGTYVYVSTLGNVTNTGVYQFNITSGNPVTIGNSRLVLDYDASGSQPWGGMQLADNGRIYVTYAGGLMYIGYPNNGWGSASGGPTGVIMGYAAAPLIANPTMAGTAKMGLPTVVKTKPVLTLAPSISIANTQVCSGSSITVNGSFTGNTTVDFHGWILEECDANNNLVAGGYVIPIAWGAGAPGSYTFPGSASVPCNRYYRVTLAIQHLPCLPWAVTSTVIYVACSPVPVITGNHDICEGSQVQLCVNYMPSSLYTIDWPGKDVAGGTQCKTFKPTVSPTEYTVSVTNTNTGCVGTASFIVNTYNNNPAFSYTQTLVGGQSYYTIVVRPDVLTAGTVPGFSYGYQVEEINPTTHATIAGTSASGTIPCWWHYPSDETFPGYNGTSTVGCSLVGTSWVGTPPEGHFLNGHAYRIIRTTTNSYCPAASDTNLINVTGSRMAGTPDLSPNKEGIRIYPNPSSGIVNVSIEKPAGKVYQVAVWDTQGRLIGQSEFQPSRQPSVQLDLSRLGLAKGLYLVRVSSEADQYTERILVE